MALPLFDPRESERGSVLIFFAIVLLTLLTFAGLAIDAGNLYRAQLAAQNAADGASLAITNYVTMRGKYQVESEAAGGTVSADDAQVSAQVTALLRNQVEHLVHVNFASQGFPHLPGNSARSDRSVSVVSQYRTRSLIPSQFRDRRSFEYEVQVRRKVDYLFIGALPFFRDGWSEVTAASTSVRNVSDIVLVLDVSGSLRCPVSGPCTCLDPNSGAACSEDASRYHRLIDAVKDFLRMFDLEKDRIYISVYNLAARGYSLSELRRYLGLQGPANAEQIEQIGEYFKQNLQPGSATNVCDGLMTGLEQIGSASPPPQNPTYVLFSDGAPTAGRFLFADDAVKPTKLDQSNLGAGNYDYDLYTVAWNRKGNIPPGESPYYYGPSLLVESAALRSDVDGEFGVWLEKPAELPPSLMTPGSSLPRCKNGRTRAYPMMSSDPQPAMAQNFGQCLSSFKAHLPGDPQRTYGSEYSPTAATPAHRDWRKQYFHCAIELSDYIREVGKGTIYAIGLGDENPAAPADDPYQLIEDETNRKDIFLSRLAMDLDESNRLRVPDADGAMKRVKFDYREYRDFSDLPDSGKRRAGVYLPTSDAGKLRLLFQHIARKILLKMVE
ncbi:MAG: VWA domain-containing protein [Bdellovibrionota bacterium]